MLENPSAETVMTVICVGVLFGLVVSFLVIGFQDRDINRRYK